MFAHQTRHLVQAIVPSTWSVIATLAAQGVVCLTLPAFKLVFGTALNVAGMGVAAPMHLTLTSSGRDDYDDYLRHGNCRLFCQRK